MNNAFLVSYKKCACQANCTRARSLAMPQLVNCRELEIIQIDFNEESIDGFESPLKVEAEVRCRTTSQGCWRLGGKAFNCFVVFTAIGKRKVFTLELKTTSESLPSELRRSTTMRQLSWVRCFFHYFDNTKNGSPTATPKRALLFIYERPSRASKIDNRHRELQRKKKRMIDLYQKWKWNEKRTYRARGAFEEACWGK